MINQSTTIIQAKKDLNSDGFAVIKGLLSNSKELTDLKDKIYKLVCIKAHQYNITIPENYPESINQKIMEINSSNKLIGAFLNDSLNASPELFRLLSSKTFEALAQSLIGNDKGCILTNNHRIRVQIPGRDSVSNLPWHQDSHYNSLYSKNSSIAIWTSVNDINLEAGPVVFKKGSHVLKQVKREEFKRPNGQIIYTIPEKYINSSEFEEVLVETKSGDIILIDMDVIHQSGANNSIDNVKFSLQCRCHDASKKGFLPDYE
ncbi:phytanoyl-CoA dioxygenase family protein [Candidatus Thioglobus sp.]|jgi:ectoine hydroxylase-related dioxygenase (phytanoyl-CoA dioxygenase family)|nr:phytanoyl-CoA dioxygenase family protein [Candidatus Thioglobus sp.]